MQKPFQHVAVLKGGFSAEREVSLESGAAIANGLRKAGYTVTEITPTQVTLQAGDKKNLTLKIGDLMRQESGHWELAGQGEVPAGTSAAESVMPGDSSPASALSSGPAAGNSAAAEILKRLMQKREQESK